mmetsp:Transcript_10278/g.23774  ORF Transcript_10278/g.23774 Transcript_10278/m.23774 type:complete len:499 (+) Transcript_10278:279-1775(+)
MTSSPAPNVSGIVLGASALAAAVIGGSMLTRRAGALGKIALPSPAVARAFRGGIAHSLALGKLQVFEDGLLVVGSTGTIEQLVDLGGLKGHEKKELLDKVRDHYRADVTVLGPSELLIPGLVDAHAHAPQYAYLGTGMDLPLLQWLETYTFPCEAKFKDTDLAKRVYTAAVRRSLAGGTTACSWFATLHLEGSKTLADVVAALGQRAHVGKVSMDRNSPDFYVEKSTAQGLADVAAFVEYVDTAHGRNPTVASDDALATGGGVAPPPPLITPSIIPRFVPSCTSEMMRGLGKLSASMGRRRQPASGGGGAGGKQPRCLPVHSHLSESLAEIAWVTKELHPEAETYAHVYKEHGLLHSESYMAHCVHCCDKEVALLRETEAGVVHCPSSNFMLKSGVCDVRRLLLKGVKVGLGTDIAGGSSVSMIDCMRQAVVASRASSFGSQVAGYEPLTFAEVFHLATKGSAQVLGMHEECGDLLPGKRFDALVVRLSGKKSIKAFL